MDEISRLRSPRLGTILHGGRKNSIFYHCVISFKNPYGSFILILMRYFPENPRTYERFDWKQTDTWFPASQFGIHILITLAQWVTMYKRKISFNFYIKVCQSTIWQRKQRYNKCLEKSSVVFNIQEKKQSEENINHFFENGIIGSQNQINYNDHCGNRQFLTT